MIRINSGAEYLLIILFVIHSLKYFYTGSSEAPNLPEFVVVGMVDDVQMFHYDSSTEKAEPTQEWMNEVTAEDPEYWEKETGNLLALKKKHVITVMVNEDKLNS
uniref:MHC class I-like antigen recognition-like domain-containing protein n=1 Tax=Amphilophus citrinellus TaxID=61819 RepID=A0A3Q0QZY9_AMPCI